MLYVPVVVPPTPPSPRTRELAELLGRVIEEYEKHHPSVTGSEVRAALQMASQSSKTVAPAAALVAGVGLAFLFAGLAAFFFVQGGSLSGGDLPWNAVVLVFMSVIAVAFLLKRLAGK